MNEYKVDEPGWLTNAINDIRAGKEFALVVSWKTAQNIIQKTKEAAEHAGGGKALLETINRLVGGAAGPLTSMLPEASLVTGMLAAIGALAAMEGSVFVVAGWAHFKYDLDVGLHVPKGMFDPDTLSFRVVASKAG